MKDILREVASWKDYELLDSGDGEKCERFGEIILVRPDPLALWSKANPGGSWTKANAVYTRDAEDGRWNMKSRMPEHWSVSYQDFTFGLKPTSFKHVGVFPEQASNWDWIKGRVHTGSRVLNLFAYTGGATLAAAQAGASVVHVDASRPVVDWAKENALASGLAHAPIRWLVDDVVKFVEREVRRGNTYDMIVMDPPAFGHGPKNELWKFERDMASLLGQCEKLLEPASGTLLVNAYALGYPLLCIEQLASSIMLKQKNIETVELVLKESTPRAFGLPTGVTVRVTW